MKIKLTSVMVGDQDKALAFYTDVLGFVEKHNIPMGEHKWLTVVSPDAPDAVELLLEPTGYPFARTFQKALFDAGIPLTAFAVDNVRQEYERLQAIGVAFRAPHVHMGPTVVAQFDDTCGNYIQIYQG